ncbi:hypothetical protein PG993_011892 [Apiospora rasikravindrae]|uniref:Uncharacterized protein n=1 Tax=Apiospora rasikravindrae TaxID=990691 RepID=A0ABR1S2J4_9PEZI
MQMQMHHPGWHKDDLVMVRSRISSNGSSSSSTIGQQLHHCSKAAIIVILPPSSVTPEAGILSDPAVPSESDNRDRAAAQQAPLNSSGRPLGSIAAPTAAAAAPSLPSSSSPAFRGWDERVHESDSHLPQLAPPAPISKSQPTWDSSTGTPLLEEEGFDLDPPFAGGHRPETLLRREPAPGYCRSTHAGPDNMAAPMAATFAADPQPPAAEPYIQQPPYQHQQQQQQQPQQSPAPPSRQTSFGLPSIPRTTSFGWGSKKSSTEDDRRGPSPGGRSDGKSPPPLPIDPDTSGEEDAFSPDSRGASPIDNVPQSAPGQQPYYGHISAQAPSSPSHPSASMSHHIAGQLAPHSPVANGYGPEPSQQAINGYGGSVSDASRNSPHITSGPQHPAMGRGSPSLSQPGQMPRQTTSPLMQGQPFMSSLRPGGVSTGNPVNQLPPSPRWNLQESQLSQPLVSRKTHSPQPKYNDPLDKETGVKSQVSNAPPQPPQRIRNMGLPPVAAQKWPGLFPAGASNHQPSHFSQAPRQDQIQVTSGPRQDAIALSKPIANEFQPGDDNDLRRNPSLSKEMGGRFNGRGSTDGAAGSIRSDDVSENSDVVGFDPSEQDRRASLQVSQSPPATNGNQPHSQPMQHFPSKKKKTFFGGIGKQQSSFSVVNSDPSSTRNDPPPGKEHGRGGARKRLSELKDMFKNNGHDEDQLANPSAPQAQAQAGRPSMSDPSRPQQGAQIPIWHQQPGRPGQSGPGPGPGLVQPAPKERQSMQEPLRQPAGGMQLNSMQPPNNGDESLKKPSGGFLGLFNNRPGSRSTHGQPALGGQPMPPQGQSPPQPGQQQSRPGQMPQPVQGPTFDTMMTGVGRFASPQQQSSPPQGGRNSQGFIQMPVQAGQRPKMITIQSGSGQGSPNRTRASTLPGLGGAMNPQQPQQDVIAPNRQGAVSPLQQASRDDRPTLPSQKNSFAQDRPDEYELLRPMGDTEASNTSVNGSSHDTSVTASPPLSRKSSQERISIGGASLVPRNSPARKPVGSGPSRQDRDFSFSSVNLPTVATTQNAAPTAPTSKLHHVKSNSSVNVEPVEDHPALNDQPSLTHIGEMGGFGHGRQLSSQLSIPTPSVLSVAQTQSPISQDANRSPSHSQQQLSPKPSTGFSVQAPNTAAPADRQQFTGPPRGSSPGLALPQNPLAQTWGPQNPSRPGTTQGSGPQPQNPQQMQNQLRAQTGPAPGLSPEPPKPEHQKSTMSKFFGGSKKQQAALQPSNSSAQSKESTKDKLKSVFKRSSKVPEPNQQQQQQQQQQRPQGQQQQMSMHMMQGGRGVPGQPMPPGMQRPPMGPNGTPQGSFPGPGQPPGPMQAGQGRGQMPPVQAGRGMFLPGQIPPQMLQQMQLQAGRGQMPPHMMAGRGQAPPQQPTAPGRGQEPQYGPVPIPQGYQPVHGYGNTGGAAFSPHMYGQQFQGYPGPMQQQQQQFGPNPSNSPPSGQSPFGQAQPQFQQGGMQMGMAQGPPQQQFAQAQGFPQGQPQPSPHHSQSPPPQQPMMHTPPPQGQQLGRPSADGQRRMISPESSQDLTQADPSSRVSSMSPQNDGGMPKPNLQHIATTLNAPQQSQQQQPNPHIQHPGSPQNYPLPDSAATFSPVNPAAGRLPNPPAPAAESVHGSEPATERGNISDISHTPSPRSGVNGPGVAMTHNFPVAEDRTQSASLSPDPSRAPHHQVSNPTLNINQPGSNNHAGAIGAAAVGGAALGITAGAAAQGDMAHNGSYFVQAPNGGNYDVAAGGTPSIITETSTPAAPGDYPATPYDQSGGQQQPQSEAPAEPEEKILVDQPVELAAAPDDLDDGIPVMSATSYPGQEWNPYGYGEFGDFEG